LCLKALAVIFAVAAGGYAAYAFFFPSESIRYRLTVDVDVNGVKRVGSGVIEISYTFGADALANLGASYVPHMRGYAITIDLDDRGPLFVIDAPPMLNALGLDGPAFPHAESLGKLPLVAFGFPDNGTPSSMRLVINQLKKRTAPVQVPPENLPTIEHFRVIDSRESLEVVNPRDPAAVLGPGVEIVAATVQVTQDAVTPMPSVWPKWLAEEKNVNTLKVLKIGPDNHYVVSPPTWMFIGE
jgi:hypothetical protein